MTGHVQKHSDRAWYAFDSVGISPEFVRDARENYKRTASGCIKDDATIEITKKAVLGICFNKVRGEFYPLYMSPVQILKFGINSREYIPHFSWVLPTNAQGIPIEKAMSIWTAFVSPEAVDRTDIYNIFFNTHPGSTCQAWELSDLPYADMTADGARSHASRRRDILTAMAEVEVNLSRGVAGGVPTTPATTATASPPSPGSPAEDAGDPAAGAGSSSHDA